MFIGLFLIIHNVGSISTGLVAAGVASAIPIGFLLYQAYTANVLWIYGRCNQRGNQRCLVPIQRTFQELWKEGKTDEVHHLSKRVLTIITNKDDKTGAYVWRLVTIVNTRGVALFAILIAAFTPISYLVMPTLFSSAVWPTRLVVFYAILVFTALPLYCGIPKVRNQLDNYQEWIVGRDEKEIKKIVKEIVKEKTRS